MHPDDGGICLAGGFEHNSIFGRHRVHAGSLNWTAIVDGPLEADKQMRDSSRMNPALLPATLMALVIAGCGQMGPLTRPSEPPRAASPAETPAMPDSESDTRPPASQGTALPDAPPADP